MNDPYGAFATIVAPDLAKMRFRIIHMAPCVIVTALCNCSQTDSPFADTILFLLSSSLMDRLDHAQINPERIGVSNFPIG